MLCRSPQGNHLHLGDKIYTNYTAVQTGGNLLDGRDDGTVHIIAIRELIKYSFYDGKTGKVGDIFSAARLLIRCYIIAPTLPSAIDRFNSPK